jgi:tetratricopeptide (TPR) repeat protein
MGILTVAAVGAYANSLGGVFLFDDVGAIVENPTIRSLWTALFPPGVGLTVDGRPLLNLTFALNYAWGGLDVVGYHLVNITLHLASALVLFGLVRRTLQRPALAQQFGTRSPWLALVIALVWLVHPLQTESVTYVVQRAESLAGLWFLLTLYCVLRSAADSHRRFWTVAAVVSSGLGMGSKEIVVVAPLLVLLYDRAFLAGSYREALRVRWRLYAGLAATWLILAGLMLQAGTRGGTAGFGRISVWHYALTQAEVICLYLRLCFWPAPLVLDYGIDVETSALAAAPYAIVVLALLTVTTLALWKHPRWGFVGAWFFCILAPTSSFVPISSQTMAEHRMYLPLAAVVVSTVVGGDWLLRRVGVRTLAVVPAIIAVLLFGALTWRRNLDYRSEEAMWTHNIANRPQNFRAYLGLGDAALRAGNLGLAVEHYDRAIAVRPDHSDPWFARGNLHLQQSEYAAARADFRRAVECDPMFPPAWKNLGMAEVGLNNDAAAIEAFDRAIAQRPSQADAWLERSGCLLRQRKLSEALRDAHEAVEWGAGAQGFNQRGYVLKRMGRLEAALADYNRALALDPTLVEALANRGSTWGQMRRPEQALADFSRAIALQPDLAEVYRNRAFAYYETGQIALARADIERFRELGGEPPPGFVQMLSAAGE